MLIFIANTPFGDCLRVTWLPSPEKRRETSDKRLSETGVVFCYLFKFGVWQILDIGLICSVERCVKVLLECLKSLKTLSLSPAQAGVYLHEVCRTPQSPCFPPHKRGCTLKITSNIIMILPFPPHKRGCTCDAANFLGVAKSSPRTSGGVPAWIC